MNRFDRRPEIDYLAKDFASFRQLMVEQIALLVPDWQERHPADLGNVLVEILAYAADYLSYTQDAVATEAYLGTARLRRSVRRHARLLDYTLHNGCNARAWVHIALNTKATPYCLPKGTRLLAGVAHVDQSGGLTNAQATVLMQDASVQEFRTLHDVHLSVAQPEIAFFVQDRSDAVLRKGAVSALLVDRWSEPTTRVRALDDLRSGDVLILEQRLDPASGLSAGVDPGHRHPIRLTKIERISLGQPPAQAVPSPHPSSPPPPVRITWDQADALPFDLPVGSFRGGPRETDAPSRELSVALRNIVLVDHGAWVGPETLPPVQPADRYRPYLNDLNVTFATPYDHAQMIRLPANVALFQRPHEAQAVVELTERQVFGLPGTGSRVPPPSGARIGQTGPAFESLHRWTQQRDLLSSDRSARTFVVETEDDGRAYLRFGFDGLGKGLAAGNTLAATYRVGNGTQGNVGRHAIAHLVTDDQTLSDALVEVRNPLPVVSGIDAEPIQAARLAAPYAFQSPLSCISPDDYAALAERFPGGTVRQARARVERTGNWQTIAVYVKRQGDQTIDPAFRDQLLAWLRPQAMTGYDLAIRSPRYVDVELHLRVQVAPHRFKNAVREAVEQALGNGLQENGLPGFFYPDSLAFGQSIYRSQVIEAAMSVDGVAGADIVWFGRMDDTRLVDPLSMGDLEIARLQHDPRGQASAWIDFEGGL